MMDKSIEEANRKALNAGGKRVTSQRALILDIIRRGDCHLDADEVYRLARERQPNLSLSTVYRTLRIFEEMGLVKKVHLDEEHHHYEVNAPGEHHHLLCISCGKLVDFEYPMSRHVTRNVPEASGFEIIETEIQIKGVCPECRKKR